MGESVVRSLELQKAAVVRFESEFAPDSRRELGHPKLAIVVGPDATATVAAIRSLKHRWHGIRVLVVGATDEEDAVLSCIAAGADGLVGPDESLEQLEQAVRDVLANGFRLPPRLARPLFDRLIRLDPKSRQQGRPLVTRLSAKEVEILRCLARGMSNKGIANELRMEVQTVKNHVTDIHRKLGVHSRFDAVRVAPGGSEAS
ncbi:MAG: LuxR C-terminal-related transcriptional regulator [Candidatus Binatia bacterium]